tara:strand:+ start:241 stop:387 length:147 start_codon:yes stop_codon:yes gene_type:complete
LKNSDLIKNLKLLIKKYPKISSGRKNLDKYHSRILKTLNLINKYFKKN